MTLPSRWISLDPGDSHVGMTSWEGREPIKCIETDPDGCLDRIEALGKARALELIVCEKWMLYPEMIRAFIWSEFETCQLIGAIKRLCKMYGIVYVGQTASQGKSTYKTGWFKELTLAEKKQMIWWGVKGKQSGVKEDHGKDSWAHGKYYIKKQEGTWF